MAFMVDFMANPFEGYEDEETRRKRIEEQRKLLGETEVGKTEVTQYADGSQTRTITQEVPAQQDLMYRPQQESGQFMRPVLRPDEQARMMPVANQNLLATPQNAGQFQRPLATPQNMGRFTPVSPDDFQNILEIESGNRDYTAGGQPMTSPKGARFAAQVMPSTARNPGFGIRPAQSETPEEYNRVGREYFAAMRQRYGDDERAAAAYNAGPGRVDAALRQAQQTGQDYRTFLPQETQQYLQKFAAGRQQPAPQQQLQQQPQQPQLGPSLIQRPPEVGAGAEGTMGEDVAQQRLQTYNQNFLRNQDNIEALLRMREDAAAPSTVRNLASERAYELLNAQVTKERADRKGQELITNNDTKKIGNILASDPKDEEGSYLKLFLLGFVSPEAARMEASKLGLVPTKYSQATIQNEDGTQSVVQLKTRADGKVVGGIDMEGRELSKDMLNKAMAGVGQKLGVVGGTYVNDTTGEVGRVITDEKTGVSYVQTDKGRKPMTGFRPQSSTGTLADQRTRLIQEMNLKLQGKTAEEQMAIQRNYNQQLVAAGYPPLQPSDTPLVAPQISGQQPAAPARQPSGAVAPTPLPTAPAAAPTAAAPAAAAPAIPAMPTAPAGVRPTGTQLETQKAEAKAGVEIAQQRSQSYNKYLDEEVATQANAGNTVSAVRKQQFQIFNRPGIDTNKLFGLYNAAQENPNDQKLSIIRDIFGGIFKPEAEVSQRLAQLNLTPAEKSALQEYNIANQRINAATLKQSAGAGAVSDAEQRANKESNVDITKIPALGAYNAMAQSQFDADRARWKSDWAMDQKTTNVSALEREWRKESQRLSKIYEDIARERIKFINQNGNTTAAVREGYRRYPVPEYDPTNNRWIKTKPLGEILGR